ncbi:MAG: acylneuraminate cytidylyltransferase, partial [Candidatus Marinimicrobia bacterium CG_4_9_14_3_um_filter_48_9]
QQFGAEVIPRPRELAGDSATTESAVAHALDWLSREKNIAPETIVLLQP